MFINSISIGGKDAICITIHDVTDTRSAERELQESESMYRSLVENSPDMIMEVTTSGTILYTNRIMKGLSKEEAVGTHMLDYIPREEHVRIRKIIDRALRKKKNTSYEISVINPNGKRWWETRVIPMERDGRVDKLLFIVSDVTHAKRAEEALIKSEENYRNLVEHLPQIVFAHINGKIVYVNHNSYSVMGFKSEADVIGKNLLDFIHHTDRDRMEKLMKTVAVEKGTRKNVEMKIVTMDGDVLDIIGNAIDVEYEGSPARLVVIHDITERKKAEEALRASERQFRYLTENMRDAVWIMDLDWKHKYISPSITNIRGFSTDEIFELPVENSLTPWSLDQANCLMAEAMANNGYDKDGNPYQVTFEQEEYCKDGSTVWTEVRASFVYDDNGNPVGTMGITRDITERREAEKKLTAERNFLEQIVDLNPYGIMTYSKDGYPVSNNRAFFDMFKSVPPPDWNIFNTEYSRKSDLGPYFEKIQKGEVVKIPRHFFNAHEINPKYPDHSCWYQSTTFPIRDTKGQIDKFVAMYEDISEIVRAEEAMSKADSSFQTLADKLPVGMFLFKDQKLIYANRQALEIAGYESLSDIVGINAIEFVDDEHKDVILEKIVDLEKNPDEPQSAQVVMRRADGSTFPVNSIGLNIDFGGEPAIVVMFSRAAEESQVIQ
ncbi:MAG TPA: PAS domain S-box protein [bacterium]|jgi:PAS domain S-box-containing protein